MISFQRAGELLDEAAEALPQGIFEHLNGGVNLLPRVERDEYGFTVLGRYYRNAMGRYVELYYGSFRSLYGGEDESSLRERLTRTLYHELTHHVEDLAGDRSLEKTDILQKAAWLAGLDCGDEGDEKQPPPKAVCTVTDASPFNLRDISRIEQACFSDPWPDNILRDNLTDGERHVCLCAMENGRLLGYLLILYAAGEGDISNVAVDPDERRRGVGGQLVNAGLERARELELTTLGLEVRESNAEALALYEKAGFVRVGRRKNYYRRPKEDAILMTREL